MEPQRLWTLAEAAEVLGVSEDQIGRVYASRAMPYPTFAGVPVLGEDDLEMLSEHLASGSMRTNNMAKSRDIVAAELPEIPKIPPLHEDREYAELAQRIAELRVRNSAVERKLTELSERLSQLRMQDNASRLLDPNTPIPVEVSNYTVLDELREQLGRCQIERRAYQEAIEQGESLLRRRQVAITRQLADLFRPLRSAIAIEQAKLLCSARRLLAHEQAIRAAQEEAGYDLERTEREYFPALGQVVSTPYGPEESELVVWLKALIEDGVLTGREGWLKGSGVGQDDEGAREDAARQREAAARQREAAREAAAREAAARQREAAARQRNGTARRLFF